MAAPPGSRIRLDRNHHPSIWPSRDLRSTAVLEGCNGSSDVELIDQPTDFTRFQCQGLVGLGGWDTRAVFGWVTWSIWLIALLT